MIAVVDIGNFIEWFIQQSATIISDMITKLNDITWNGGLMSLGYFILGITIINVFLGIVLNSTRHTGNKIGSTIERKKK